MTGCRQGVSTVNTYKAKIGGAAVTVFTVFTVFTPQFRAKNAPNPYLRGACSGGRL